MVHRAHHAREHGPVADAGVEQADRRRPRPYVPEFHRDALCHHPLLGTGVDEQKVLLPVVEKAEIAGVRDRGCRRLRRHARGADLGGATDEQRPLPGIGSDERAHALECRRRDASALAQAVDEFAVIDGQPPERRFGYAVLPAVIGDFAQQCFRLHGLPSSGAINPGAISGQIKRRVNEFFVPLILWDV